jgi:Zn-dependent protease
MRLEREKMDQTKLFELLYITVILLLALPLHEFAHAWVAYRFGDTTAKDMGRLTLNPFKHLDLLGSVMMYVAHFGWAKPVPVDPRNFRNRRFGMLLVALAGPFSNLVLAFASMLLLGLLAKLEATGLLVQGTGVGTAILDGAVGLFRMLVQINVILAVFNMIPVPPLDGSRILSAFLPDAWMARLYRAERWIGLAFLFIVVILPRITGNTGIIGDFIGAASDPILSGMTWVTVRLFGL